MKAADVSARIESIVQMGKRMEARSAEYGLMVDRDVRHSAEAGGLSATVKSMLEELEKLKADIQPKRGKR